MIMISHDLSVLSATCERLAVMYAGLIVEEGPAHEVFTGARHPYAEALAWAFPVIGDASVAAEPARSRRRLPGPGRRAVRLLLPPALRGARSRSARQCTRELWPAGPAGSRPASGCDRAALVSTTGPPLKRTKMRPVRQSHDRDR